MSLRETTGLGLGYDILASKQHVLTVSAGPGGVYQDYTTTPATITPSATWIAGYEGRFRDDDVILFHKQQGFKDLAHGEGTRLNADQGIRIKITDRWRVNMEYDLRYNSLPVAGPYFLLRIGTQPVAGFLSFPQCAPRTNRTPTWSIPISGAFSVTP